MLTLTNAQLRSVERGGESRETIMRSTVKDCHVFTSENEIEKQRRFGRDSVRAYNHRGTVVVASAWLVLYAVMSFYHLVASD